MSGGGLTKGGRRLRVAVKRFVYSQLYLRDALLLLLGRAKPLVRFKVEATPPSIYFNFPLLPEAVEQLEGELGLPHPLAPIACLEGEAPYHCLTLNVYRVSGLANGIRAEWSLYVRDAGGKPRYLVVEAAADAGSMDPVHVITRAGQVAHVHQGEWLESEIVAEGGSRFRARVRRPEAGRPARCAPEWVEANDFIYWRNGICDRTFYDSGLANARVHVVDPGEVEIQDETSWGRVTEKAPRSVVVFENPIEFAMSPWWNVDEL